MFAWRRTAVRKRVVVNLDSGTAISGILWASRGPLLVIRDATLHTPEATPRSVDGEIVIERSRVEFVQAV